MTSTVLHVTKRDGRTEAYSHRKLKKAVTWCTNSNKVLAKELLNALDIKLHSNIKIEKLWDEVIATAANKISEMFPIWDQVATRAYVLKIYKETYGNKRIENGYYPDYLDVVKKGVTAGVYTKEVLISFTAEELNTIGSFVEMERDLLFPFIGVVSIMDKYSMNQTLTKKLELPQHIYMRVAIAGFINDTSSQRLEKIKKRYDDLSTFKYTEATPKMINSLSPKAQLASCVLQEVADNTESINHTDTALSLFSKYGGGLALDVSKLRCSLSSIGKNGARSDGPIPFIQKFESTVNAFNQGGRRKGALVITFPFWHYDVMDLIMLKDAGGSDDTRARKLQYTMKWYGILTKRIKEDGYITLFDPKETPELNTTYGADFEKAYLAYEDKSSIRKRKVQARELAFLVAKVRSETGNLYVIFPDNVNKHRMIAELVFASNLCTEIIEPTKANTDFSHSIEVNYTTGKAVTNTSASTGEIALCNLTSINLMSWVKLSAAQKEELIDNLLEASDNLIDSQFYPVAEGEYSNKKRRPIGIGQSNYAGLLADSKVLFTDKEAEELTFKVYEDLAFHIYSGSNRLAKSRGAHSVFSTTPWAKGQLPFSNFNIPFRLSKDWDTLSNEIQLHGLRFSLHMATAPTATSGQIIRATEGIEPIKRLSQMKEGTYTLPVLVPHLQKNRQYYQSAFDIPNETLNTLNAVRQLFIDQSQSFSHYYKETDSAYRVISDIVDAEAKGIKTLYYLQPMKSDDIEGCESCSS